MTSPSSQADTDRRDPDHGRRRSDTVAVPAELIAQALDRLHRHGLAFEELEVNAGFRRQPKQDALWYVADAGTGRSGRPWLLVTAGDARVTGDVRTPLVVFKSWESDGQVLTPEESAERHRQLREITRQREAHAQVRREAAAEQARVLWSQASEALDGHAYLTAKGVQGHGIRRRGEALLIPVRDAHRTLHGLQLISPDATKRFHPGSAVAGHFHLIGQPGRRLYLCEGYATGATLHEASGEAVAVAFSAGNLGPVAAALRTAYPRAELLVCADDDRNTEGNPGVRHARAAAAAVGGKLVVPKFQRPGPDATDFNDLARREGLEVVRAQLQRPARVASVTTGLSIVCAERFRPEPVAWLWDGWLARGKVHVLAGAPGTGKTSVSLALAATLTTAGRWPDGRQAPLGSVLVWSGEDDPQDTLVPRLIACGADLARVHFVGSVIEEDGRRSFDPARDAELLREETAQMSPPPALLIVDPLVCAVAGDSHKNAEVRRALQPLVDLAATVRCAVLGISHFTKGTAGRDPVERVTGSLAFGALARVVLAAAKRSEEDGGGRMLARAKNNLGPDSGGFAYDLQPLELAEHPGVHTTRVLWGEVLEGSARALLSQSDPPDDPEGQSALDDAKEWLAYTLGFGPVDGKRLKQLARAEAIAERTLYRAADALGVDRTPQGFAKARLWSLSVNTAMAAKTPICATEQGMAGAGTPGDGAPVSAISAQGCQTPGIGTPGEVGTDGEGLMVPAEGGSLPPGHPHYVEEF